MHLVTTIRLVALLADLLSTDLTVPVVAAVQIVVEVTEFFARCTGLEICGELCGGIAARASRAPHPLFGLLL